MRFPSGHNVAASARLFALLLGLTTGGCSSGAPYAESSRTEATVTGRVTSQGEPITSGSVIFDPANVNRPNEPAATAKIRQDGSYEVKTLIGANRVTVAVPGRLTKTSAPYVQKIYDVQAGSNTFDIPVP